MSAALSQSPSSKQKSIYPARRATFPSLLLISNSDQTAGGAGQQAEGLLVGLANFSRRYIDNFAMHACRLNGLLRNESAGIWTLGHAISYDAIKYDIAWSKGLYQIDYKLSIFVCTGTCKEGIGGYIY